MCSDGSGGSFRRLRFRCGGRKGKGSGIYSGGGKICSRGAGEADRVRGGPRPPGGAGAGGPGGPAGMRRRPGRVTFWTPKK